VSAHAARAAGAIPGTALLLRRVAVEDFLYREAALLDAWQLDEWLELFTEDCRYVVPATDLPDGDPSVTLGLIDDDRTRLRGRVDRLNSAKAYREFPWSRTTRLVSNVRVLPDPVDDGPELGATASFVAFRYRKGDEQVIVGTYGYRLVEIGEGDFRIRYKRVVLTPEVLRPHGTLSIIL
jgi:p-cumate 2,3-dioxygenase beta subunit